MRTSKMIEDEIRGHEQSLARLRDEVERAYVNESGCNIVIGEYVRRNKDGAKFVVDGFRGHSKDWVDLIGRKLKKNGEPSAKATRIDDHKNCKRITIGGEPKVAPAVSTGDVAHA